MRRVLASPCRLRHGNERPQESSSGTCQHGAAVWMVPPPCNRRGDHSLPRYNPTKPGDPRRAWPWSPPRAPERSSLSIIPASTRIYMEVRHYIVERGGGRKLDVLTDDKTLSWGDLDMVDWGVNTAATWLVRTLTRRRLRRPRWRSPPAPR